MIGLVNIHHPYLTQVFFIVFLSGSIVADLTIYLLAVSIIIVNFMYTSCKMWVGWVGLQHVAFYRFVVTVAIIIPMFRLLFELHAMMPVIHCSHCMRHLTKYQCAKVTFLKHQFLYNVW